VGAVLQYAVQCSGVFKTVSQRTPFRSEALLRIMHGPATDQPGANGASRVGDGAAELVVVLLEDELVEVVEEEAGGNGLPPQSVPRPHSTFDEHVSGELQRKCTLTTRYGTIAARSNSARRASGIELS
jgi:hypothetical protein